jgi:hypothetical protein
VLHFGAGKDNRRIPKKVETPGGFTPATSNSVEGVYSPSYSPAGPVSALRPFYRVPAGPALRQYELNGVLSSSGAWSLVVVTYRGAP